MGGDWGVPAGRGWDAVPSPPHHRGAVVRLGGLGGLVRANTDMSPAFLWLESAIQPGYFLAALPDTRLVWRRRTGTGFSVFCADPYTTTQRYSRCQLRVEQVGTAPVLVRVYNKFLVWCSQPDCWYSTPTSHWQITVMSWSQAHHTAVRAKHIS